ncbi:hypothetical protein CSOJ01_09840 [Colletotrichum sojae]|uniref:Uncharacterized protein n=1 Tax=Colletotrichum sojae TaxID=2175907 RepID=A0A8H6J202_9PEZI|nr:hypothetical protein CSOJ01_09840 [Colletotrichum sojae]
MGDFHATIASGSFVEGGSYFLPGASLITNELFVETNGPGFGNGSLLPTFDDLLNRNYSAYALNISNAAVNASSWKRLGAPAFWPIFQERSCTGLKDHRNVVTIARGPGWKKSELWNLSTTADELWEPVVPRDGTKFSTSKTIPWDKADRWNASLYAAPGDGCELGFLPDSFNVDIDYCLVEPRDLITVGHGDEDYANDPTSLPEDAVITLSVSPAASLAFLVVGVVLLLLPVAISAQKLPGQMPVVGSNSLAIAAACRVSPLAKTYGDFGREHKMQTAEAGEPIQVPDEDAGVERPDITQDFALYRLKWGEIRMPDYWYFGMGLGHLSFGSVFDDPQPPTHGRLYR